MKLVNAKEMMSKAFEGKYAIPQININNLEWAKVVLETCQEIKSPVILGVSGGAAKYMAGFKTVKGMVDGMMEFYNITVPVALHLDHGTYEQGVEAIAAGFTSVMFDGSHFPFEENIEKTKSIIELANKHDVSVEVEVGTLGGEEDGIVGTGEIADPKEVAAIAATGPTMIAAGINNIHGPYPEGWDGLRLDVLNELSEAAGLPLVLHGGSGIPEDQVKEAIAKGMSKVNINTELQLSNAAAIKEFVVSGDIDKPKMYDPRKILAPSHAAMKATIIEKAELCGSAGKA